METPKSIIHVAIAFDNNYIPQFYALIYSILTTNKNNKIFIHAIAGNIDILKKIELENEFESSDLNIKFYDINEELINKFILSGTWTAAVYYRLFFPFLVPETVEQLLYIDTDTLVVGDLRQFEQIELGTYPVAAVYDIWVKTQPLIGITEEGDYFNSGMLYMNVKEWQRQRISEQAFNYLLQYPERIKFVDQCALNAVLRDNWKKLDSRFNTLYSYIPEALARRDFTSFLADKVILHFTLERPWTMLCRNRFRYLYRYYLQLSPSTQRASYTDFAFKKLPRLIRIRLREFYFDHPGLARQWRQLKGR